MALTETYKRMRNVSSATDEKGMVGTYKDYFAETPPEISDAQDLVIGNNKKSLVLTDDKFNMLRIWDTGGVQDLLSDVQSHWFDFIDVLLEYLSRRSGTIPYYSSSNTYNVGQLCKKTNASSDDIVYMCISNITTAEAWNPAHWKMLTPNSFGFNWEDKIEVDFSGGVITLTDADTSVEYAHMITDLVYLDDETDAINGMVYLIDME